MPNCDSRLSLAYNGQRSISLRTDGTNLCLEFARVARDYYSVIWVPVSLMLEQLPVADGTPGAGAIVTDASGAVEAVQVSGAMVRLAYAPDRTLLAGIYPGIQERVVELEQAFLAQALALLTHHEHLAPVRAYYQYAWGGGEPPAGMPLRAGDGKLPTLQGQAVTLPDLLALDRAGQLPLDPLSHQVAAASRFLYRALARKDWTRMAVTWSAQVPRPTWGFPEKTRSRDDQVRRVCEAVYAEVEAVAAQVTP